MILKVVGDLDANIRKCSHNLTTCLTLPESILLANHHQHYLHNRVTHCYTQSGDCLLASYQQSSVQGRLSQPCCLLAGCIMAAAAGKYITKLFQTVSEPPKRKPTFKKFQPLVTFWNYFESFTQFFSRSACLNWCQLVKESTLRNYESNESILYRELPPKDD